MLNSASDALVKHTKIETKHKINVDKINFVYFQYIECMTFKDRTFLFRSLYA
jgi:hypothetical protein